MMERIEDLGRDIQVKLQHITIPDPDTEQDAMLTG
jgi:hypothetical protein